MAAQKPRPLLPTLLAGSGIVFALVAATCETEFPPYVQELCGDSQDNDSDGKADCQDSDCAAECAVEVTIDQLPAADADSLAISGTTQRATSVTVTVTPSGTGGRATPKPDGTWELMLRDLTSLGETHTVTAIASGAAGLGDTARTTFLRNP